MDSLDLVQEFLHENQVKTEIKKTGLVKFLVVKHQYIKHKCMYLWMFNNSDKPVIKGTYSIPQINLSEPHSLEKLLKLIKIWHDIEYDDFTSGEWESKIKEADFLS